jgi:predicted RNA-binding protein with TRAM domain
MDDAGWVVVVPGAEEGEWVTLLKNNAGLQAG